MAKPYSKDLRERVVAAVEGDLSRTAAFVQGWHHFVMPSFPLIQLCQ